jgi:hypothetical protein
VGDHRPRHDCHELGGIRHLREVPAMMGGLEFYAITFVILVTLVGIIYIVARANNFPIPAWFF